MNSKDLIFCEKNGKVYSCGYSVKSLFLEQNIKPMNIFEDKELNQYVIPAGLTYFMNVDNSNKQKYTHNTTSHESLYDKLLDLMDTEDKIKYRNNRTLKKKMKTKRKSSKKNRFKLFS